jgi:hypothetical protein
MNESVDGMPSRSPVLPTEVGIHDLLRATPKVVDGGPPGLCSGQAFAHHDDGRGPGGI